LEAFFENNGEERESLKRFEEILKSGESTFFDFSTFEFFISHYIGANELDKALKACNLGLEQYPYNSQLKIDLAQIYADSGDFKNALIAIDEVEVYQPTDPELLFLKGSILYYLEEIIESKSYFEKVLYLSENKENIYFFLGLIAQVENDVDTALSNFKACLQINPSNNEALFELTSCLEMYDKLEEGIDFYQEFIDKDPYSTTAWYNLGIVYDKLHNYIKAVEAYDYATIIDNSFSAAHYNMGLSYIELSEYKKAIDCLNRTIEIEGWEDTYIYFNLGKCFENLGNLERAILLYRKSVSLDNKNDDSWYAIGNVLDKQEKWHESIFFFQKAFESNEFSQRNSIALAEAEYKTGNIVSSIEAYEKASVLNSTNTKVWLDWSYVYFEQGDYDKAKNLIEIGIDESPEASELYYRMTAYLISQGNYKEGFIFLENALVLNFEKHVLLFEFFPELETQKALIKIIDQYRGNVR